MKGPPPQLFLPEWFTQTICLIGQGEACCRYLAVGENGHICVKLISSVRRVLDTRQTTFIAKGDNCPGTPMIDPKSIRGN